MSWFHPDRRAVRKRKRIPRWEAKWRHLDLESHYRTITGRFKTEQEAHAILLARYAEQFPINEDAGEENRYELVGIVRLP